MSFSISFLGHSTVLVTLPSKKTILIDPWLDGNPSCPEQFKSFDNLDLICLTHGHSDHSGSVVELAIKTKAIVCATYELASLLNKDGVPESQLQFMNKGGSVKIPSVDNISVTLTHAQHSSSYTSKDGSSNYAGEACGIVVNSEQGISIYHAGDTSLFSDMRLIKELYHPEVALLPIGDRFTMGPKEAALATKLILPSYVIPIHWGTFPLLTGTTKEFSEALVGVESELVVLNPGESKTFGL
jgi:L-ascorbate metabolism protein UlaG (beta-lactamase superfamily)